MPEVLDSMFSTEKKKETNKENMIVKAYALNDRTLKFCKINSI
jgi:hypothetical protein